MKKKRLRLINGSRPFKWAYEIVSAIDRKIAAEFAEYAKNTDLSPFAVLNRVLADYGFRVSIWSCVCYRAQFQQMDLSDFALRGPESAIGIMYKKSVATIYNAKQPYAMVAPVKMPNGTWIEVAVHQCFHCTHFVEPQILASHRLPGMGLVVVEPWEDFIGAFVDAHKHAFAWKRPPQPYKPPGKAETKAPKKDPAASEPAQASVGGQAQGGIEETT
jgi:hypothetical protein